MKAIRTAVIVTVAALGLAGLTACADSTDNSPPSASQAAAAVTDVAFAQSMIPHHQQAVEMASLALSDRSGASEQVKQLATQIEQAQGPEIDQMTLWLQNWGAPTAMPGGDSADQMPGLDHGGHDMGGMTVSGMMTTDQMDQLEGASGQQFDDMWLRMMVDHHQGAIAMAQQVKSASQDAAVIALADQIISAQQAEIANMQDQLAGGAR